MKKICSVFLLAICLVGCSESQHTTAFTPELYYLPELAMKKAGVTKQTTTIYTTAEDSNYKTIEEVVANVEPFETKTILSCDFKANKCEEYFQTGESVLGKIEYDYRFDASNEYILAKIGDGVYREFLFDKGHLNGISDYVGTEKTADSEAISGRQFVYTSNGICISNVVESVDNSGNAIQYRYTFQYDDDGILEVINTIGTDINGEEAIVGHIDFTYTEDGLMNTATYYAIVGEEKRIVSHQEYSYE